MAYQFRRWIDAPVYEVGFDFEQYEELVHAGCPDCGSSDLKVHGQARSNGVMTYRLICDDCGADIKELRHEVSAESLEGFVIPIGVNKGKTLAEAPVTWLRWAASNFEGGLGRKVRTYLKVREAQSRGF